MNRVYNFAPGPSMLATEVLEKVQKDLLCYGSTGMSVMEMSHRSKMYLEIFEKTVADLRNVMGVPEGYKVMFLQGGATAMFSAVPLNLMQGGKADYIDSGNFAHNALVEAQKYGEVNVAWTGKGENFCRIPRQEELKLSSDADYVHICFNNTIYGSCWDYIPDTGDVPLVADLSSCILSRPIDVSKFAVIYAGAQKNVAPAGLTIVIIREDLLHNVNPVCPTMCDYTINAEAKSMHNTPPCWSIYICKLVLDWLLSIGGLEEMERRNLKKAALLYNYLDSTDFYTANISPESRSIMNVRFNTPNEELDAKFVKESVAAGMTNLKAHRSTGGLRASIYNCMPYEGVECLVDFMKKFEAENK